MNRAFASLLFALSAVFMADACASTAVGVDECRRIESARCRAAPKCNLGIDSADEVEECIRFSDDNCLHGLPGDKPKISEVDQCVSAIASGNCGIVQNPELSPACSFLLGTTGTGGSAGTGGSTGTGGGGADAASD